MPFAFNDDKSKYNFEVVESTTITGSNKIMDGATLSAALKPIITDSNTQTLATVIKYRKIGHVVEVSLVNNNNISFAANQTTTIGTLPAGYRPTVQKSAPDYSSGAMFIATNGAITYRNTKSTATNYCGASITYLVD